MEEKVKEIVEMKQRSLAEENQKTLEVLKERYLYKKGKKKKSFKRKVQSYAVAFVIRLCIWVHLAYILLIPW